MLGQFGPALKLPWTKLQAPELTDALIDSLVEGTRAQAGDRSIAELERVRDDCLIGIMRSLRPFRSGAGNAIAEDEKHRFTRGGHPPWTKGDSVEAPLSLYRCQVEADWVDYNGQLGESFYLYAFGWASDALFRYAGIDEEYRAAGRSFYTVESHINYYRQASLGERLRFTTQILDLDEKRLHLFHAMYPSDSDERMCTTEQMLLHVDMGASAASPMAGDVHAALGAILQAHRHLPRPHEVGGQMAIERKSTA
jgi:carnitine 3-dehydrogenase